MHAPGWRGAKSGLTARVGAALRARAGTVPFVLGALAIDYVRRRVTVDGRAVALTATEYAILRILSVHAGQVVTSESLLRQAWDGGREPTDTERVRAFVKQLRAKLGDDAKRPAWIFYQRGVGYRMAKPGDAPRAKQQLAPVGPAPDHPRAARGPGTG